jgi:general secretion pathway protein N
VRADDLAVAGTPGRRGPGRAGGRLVLALALAMSLAGAHGEPAAAAPAGGAANGNRVWRVPLGSLTATRERPIFSSSRRPPAAVDRPVARATPPPPPLVAPEPEPLRLSLMGTIGGQADGVAIEAIAIFVDQATRDIVRLKTGDRHAGWMLQSVKGRSAVLESGQRSETLTLPRPDQTVAQRALRPASEPPASDGVPGSILNIEPAPLPD